MRTAKDLAQEVEALREDCRKGTDELLSLRAENRELKRQLAEKGTIITALVSAVDALSGGSD